MSRPAPKRRAEPANTVAQAEASPWILAALLAAIAIISPLLSDSPDNTTWASLVCALALTAVAVALFKRSSYIDLKGRPVALGVGGLVAVSIISFLCRWIFISHCTTQYLDVMLRSVAYWSSMAGLVYVGARTGLNRGTAYLTLVAIIAAASICSALGVQDYLIQVFRNHIHDWREFGTSSNPDYFAGYLIITIPLTLAMFLGARSEGGKRAGWIYAFALLLQMAALPTTGSRFAFVSFAVSIAAFGGCMTFARKQGLTVDQSTRGRILFLLVVAILGGLVFAGPILHRLSAGTLAAQAHSGDFRIWTWRGAFRLALHYPVFGAGPGMFVYAYPRYAFVGFTTVAHSGYLQLLDDIGPLGIIAVAGVLAGCLRMGLNALKSARNERASSPLLLNISASDDRFVIIGLISAIVAALVQNFIDSDFYITLCGVALFLCVGLLWGLSSGAVPGTEKVDNRVQPIRLSVAMVSVLFAVQCLIWHLASSSASHGDYAEAIALAPLSGQYHSELAWKVQVPAGDNAGAERNLSTALELAPDPVTYYRRAGLHFSNGRQSEALNDVNSGLAYDPHSLELLREGGEIESAQHGQVDAMRYYRRMADEEQGVYGTVLAISEIVEYRYAFADFALGDDAIKRNQLANAIPYLKQAQATLQTYADEGGSANLMRMAETGSNGPALDAELRQLYNSTMTDLIGAYRASGQTEAASTAQTTEQSYMPKFVHSPPAGSTAP